LLAENAGAALEEIEQVSNQIAMLVQNISGSAKDQAKAVKTVLKNVDQLQVISSKTDAGAANTSKYISKLSQLASQLRKAASGFTLPGSASTPPTTEAPVVEQTSAAAGAAGELAREGAA
jgi:twitching motility protein PilJ